MRKLLFISSLVFIISCKAQIYPLNTYAGDIPENSYFKDLNNEFDQYVGTWTAAYKGKTIKLVITKETDVPIKYHRKNYFKDRLFVRYEIKNKLGNILESTLNKDFSNDVSLGIRGLMTQENGNTVRLIFSGGNCSVGIGEIIFKKINSTQFYWNYYPGTTTSNDFLCPPNEDYTIYLPETENLVFKKQ